MIGDMVADAKPLSVKKVEMPSFIKSETAVAPFRVALNIICYECGDDLPYDVPGGVKWPSKSDLTDFLADHDWGVSGGEPYCWSCYEEVEDDDDECRCEECEADRRRGLL